MLDGLASYISAQTHLKGVSGSDLLAKGMRAVEESRTLAPGERMRHAFVWWHGRMDEPVRCAQYVFAAKNLLDMEKAREVGSLVLAAAGVGMGLGVSGTVQRALCCQIALEKHQQMWGVEVVVAQQQQQQL